MMTADTKLGEGAARVGRNNQRTLRQRQAIL